MEPARPATNPNGREPLVNQPGDSRSAGGQPDKQGGTNFPREATVNNPISGPSEARPAGQQNTPQPGEPATGLPKEVQSPIHQKESLVLLSTNITSTHAGLQGEQPKPKQSEYLVPPDIKLCEDYRKATMFGIPAAPKDQKEPEIEPFSHFPISNAKLTIQTPIRTFAKLGNGYFTYFYYIVLLSVLFTSALFVVSIYDVINNRSGSQCLPPDQVREIKDSFDTMMSRRNDDIKAITATGSHDEEAVARRQAEEAEDLRKTMVTYLAIKCLTSWSDRRCNELMSSDCMKNMTAVCVNKTLAFYKDEYPNTVCRDSIFTRYTSANREVSHISERSYFSPKKVLGLVWVVCGLVLIFYFHRWHNRWDEMLDADFITIQDCSARLINIPTKVPDIIRKIKDSFMAHNITLAQVCLVYDVEEFLKLKAEYQELRSKQAKEEYLKAFTSRKADAQAADTQALLDKYEKRKKDILDNIQSMEEGFKDGSSSKFIGQAYISFKTSTERDEAIKSFRPRGWKWKLFKLSPLPTFGGSQLTISDEHGVQTHMNLTKTTEPQDILWENLAYSRGNKISRQTASFLLSTLIVILDFIGIYILKVIGMNLVQDGNGKASDEFSLKNFAVDTGISVAIFSIDFLLQSILLGLAKWEKRETHSIQHYKAANKIWKVQFLASSVVPLLVSLNMFNFYGLNSLVTAINSQFITNIVLTPSIEIIKAHQIVNRLKRELVLKQLHSKKPVPVTMTQGEANEIYLKGNFEMYEKYALILKNMAMGFFYLPLIPLAAIYMLVFLLAIYFTEKYILLRHSNKLTMYSAVISKNLIVEMEQLVLIFFVGLLVEQNLGRLNKLMPLTISLFDIGLLLGIFFLIFFQVIGDLARPKVQKEEEALTYDKVKQEDFNDYDLSNPAMAAMARKSDIALMLDQSFGGVGCYFKNLPKEQVGEGEAEGDGDDLEYCMLEEEGEYSVEQYSDYPEEDEAEGENPDDEEGQAQLFPEEGGAQADDQQDKKSASAKSPGLAAGPDDAADGKAVELAPLQSHRSASQNQGKSPQVIDVEKM